jgi:hypothetical protein
VMPFDGFRKPQKLLHDWKEEGKSLSTSRDSLYN